MKKSLLLIATVALMQVSLNAQDKPVGKFALDLTFDPAAIFDAGAGAMFNMPMIKGRVFLSQSFALRVGLDYDFSNNKTYPNPALADYDRTSTSQFTIAMGAEKHFGSGKFSPYIGGDITASNGSSTVISEVAGVKTITRHSIIGFFSVGVHAAIGADFYILPNFYVGAEFSPGFTTSFNKDEKTDGTVTVKGGRTSSFSLSSTSGLRVGIRF